MFVEATSTLQSKSPSQRSYDSEAYVLSQAYQHKVRYFPLSDDFFVFGEKAISQEKLEQLATYSKTLEEPEIFGRFSTGASYLKTLELLFSSTLETEHRYEFFERAIAPVVESHDKFLDIGIGTGELTKIFGKYFNEVTVIDPVEEALNSIDVEELGPNKKLNKIHACMMDVELPKNYYNAAVISQTLYYIDNELWFNAIQKLYDSLVPGGIVAVVMTYGLGKSALINAFNGKDLAMYDLVSLCAKEFNTNIEFFVTKEIYYTLGIEPMLHITGLHLSDAEAIATREALTNHIKSNCKSESNVYQLDCQQKYMLIYKPHQNSTESKVSNGHQCSHR